MSSYLNLYIILVSLMALVDVLWLFRARPRFAPLALLLNVAFYLWAVGIGIAWSHVHHWQMSEDPGLFALAVSLLVLGFGGSSLIAYCVLISDPRLRHTGILPVVKTSKRQVVRALLFALAVYLGMLAVWFLFAWHGYRSALQ